MAGCKFQGAAGVNVQESAVDRCIPAPVMLDRNRVCHPSSNTFRCSKSIATYCTRLPLEAIMPGRCYVSAASRNDLPTGSEDRNHQSCPGCHVTSPDQRRALGPQHSATYSETIQFKKMAPSNSSVVLNTPLLAADGSIVPAKSCRGCRVVCAVGSVAILSLLASLSCSKDGLSCLHLSSASSASQVPATIMSVNPEDFCPDK